MGAPICLLYFVQAGPHRFVSLLRREGADEPGPEPGMLAVAAVAQDNGHPAKQQKPGKNHWGSRAHSSRSPGARY